ncbi:hypothetical protein D3C87_1437970 [compost metagenome]
MLAVEGDERGHEGVSLFDFQGRFFQRGLYVQWFGRQGDLALIAAQLLQTHVGVRGDGEDQRIDLGLASEVIGIGLVADRRVFLESCEDERAGADWLVVELFRRAALEQFVGIFGRVDRGEAHAQGWQERRVGVIQGEAHSQRIQCVDFLD